jgi:hypothetical protein
LVGQEFGWGSARFGIMLSVGGLVRGIFAFVILPRIKHKLHNSEMEIRAAAMLMVRA